jgi:hypothetical protein
VFDPDMPRVLFISLKFPPLSDIGAKRALRFVRRLPDHGWQPTVLTLPIPAPAQCDPSLLGFVPRDLVVSRTYARGVAFDLIDRVKARWSACVGRVVGQAQQQPASGLWRSLIYKAEDLAESLMICDEWLPFVASGYRAGLDLLAHNRHEAIYVCGDPNSAYLTGWLLARKTGLPLVLDLRDPWTLDPTIRRLKSTPTLAVEEALERRIFAGAARIILNTERARDLHVARYPAIPAAHFAAIHNAFDPELVNIARERPPASAPLTVAHFGNYHRLRSARVFLEALAQIAEARAVRFINYGELRSDDLELAARLDLARVIEQPGYVPYSEAARVLSRAHVLLLEQRNDESVQIPGKFYDYLLARRPILSLSRNPELAAALAASQAGEEVDPSSPGDVAAALTRLAATDLDAFEARHDAGAVRKFSAAETTRALAQLLDQVCGRSARESLHEARGKLDRLDAHDRIEVARVDREPQHVATLGATSRELGVHPR